MMGWEKPIWAAETIREKMPGADSGKDLYVAGLRRGLTKKRMSGHAFNADIVGCGWVTLLRAGGYYNNGIRAVANIKIIVDDGIEYSVTSSNDSIPASIIFDKNEYVSEFDQLDQGENVSIDSKNVLIALPIRFNNHLEVIATSSYGTYASSAIEYILDPAGSGGVMRKIKYKQSAQAALLKKFSFEGRRAA